MKYNRVEIMSNAWAIRRRTGCTMSVALNQSWANVKRSLRGFSIKPWFLDKEFRANERIAITGVSPTVTRETAKAVRLSWNTGYGIVTRWVPKSCLESNASADENSLEACSSRLNEIKEREIRYEALIVKCRTYGIPARKGWKVSTMKQRLAEVVA